MTKQEAIALMKQGKRVCRENFKPNRFWELISNVCMFSDRGIYTDRMSIKDFLFEAEDDGWQEYKPQEDER